MKNSIFFFLSLMILLYLTNQMVIDFKYYFYKKITFAQILEVKKIDDGFVNTYWLVAKYFNSEINDSTKVKLKYTVENGKFPKDIKIGYINFINSHEYLIPFEPQSNNLILDVLSILFLVLMTLVFGNQILKSFRKKII